MTELGREVVTERLRLILVTPADAADMRAGRRQNRWHPEYPREDDVDGAAMVGPVDSESSVWGSRHIVYEGLAVGSIGFFGPPDDSGEVEIGYGLVEPLRRRGLGGEALRAMLAAADARGVGVRASVEPANVVSLRMLAATGFTELRGSDDEGHLVMARPRP